MVVLHILFMFLLLFTGVLVICSRYGCSSQMVVDNLLLLLLMVVLYKLLLLLLLMVVLVIDSRYGCPAQTVVDVVDGCYGPHLIVHNQFFCVNQLLQ